MKLYYLFALLLLCCQCAEKKTTEANSTKTVKESTQLKAEKHKSSSDWKTQTFEREGNRLINDCEKSLAESGSIERDSIMYFNGDNSVIDINLSGAPTETIRKIIVNGTLQEGQVYVNLLNSNDKNLANFTVDRNTKLPVRRMRQSGKKFSKTPGESEITTVSKVKIIKGPAQENKESLTPSSKKEIMNSRTINASMEFYNDEKNDEKLHLRVSAYDFVGKVSFKVIYQ